MKKKTYYPTINQSFWLIGKLIFISTLTALPFVIVMSFKEQLRDHEIIKSLALLISYLVSFVWIIYTSIKKIDKQNHWKVKWKNEKVSFKILLVFAIMSITLVIIIDPLTELIPMPEGIIKIFKEFLHPNIFSFLSIVVFAPILEEFLFRGIILEGFLKNYTPWKAIIWSALIFGTAHLNPWQAIAGIFIGILLGWAYVKTNSLLPGILIHFLNNLIGFSFMVFTENESFYLSETINTPLSYMFLIITSLIVFVFGALFIEKNRSEKII